MKRLKLDDFKSQKVTDKNKQLINQALGQVLGDCHDQSDDSDDGGDKFQNPYIWMI